MSGAGTMEASGLGASFHSLTTGAWITDPPHHNYHQSRACMLLEEKWEISIKIN